MQLLKQKSRNAGATVTDNIADQDPVDNLPSLADDSIISLDIRCCEQCQNQYQQSESIKLCATCSVAQKRNLCGSCRKVQKV